MQGVYIIRWDFDEFFMFHVFLYKRLDGGAVGVVDEQANFYYQNLLGVNKRNRFAVK
jgi:hypothetical protein